MKTSIVRTVPKAHTTKTRKLSVFSCTPVAMLLICCAAVFGAGVPVELTGLSATGTPAGDPTGKFAVVDVTGYYGNVGASILFSAAQAALWTDSGIAGANVGSLDPALGTFAMNWATEALFSVFDATGNIQIGTGMLLVVSPEAGSYDPFTGDFTSETTVPAPAQIVLHRPGGPDWVPAPAGWININRGETQPSFWDAPTVVDGVFRADWTPGPELTIGMPPELGSGTLYADLSGTFTLNVIPEPSALSLLAPGGLAMLRRRRTT
jgi:hypothetical protein